MSANEKIKSTHLQRCVYVYVRQSSTAQVQYNRESTDRQYKLADRAIRLGPNHRSRLSTRIWLAPARGLPIAAALP